MAIRGVYSKAEEIMLADARERIERSVGWAKPWDGSLPIASEETIAKFAECVDRWNPIWRDKAYAISSRWGGIIAPPCYESRFGGGQIGLTATEEVGFGDLKRIGEDWEFFRPVRPGDTIRTWCRRPSVTDVTSLDGKGPRKFGLVECDCDRVNQNDELVSRFMLRVEITFSQELPEPEKMPKYRYTEEEWDYIEDVAAKEEVRGSRVRFWEDVNIGDKITPMVLGPTTVVDVAAEMGNMPRFDPKMVRQQIRYPQLTGKLLPDPESGLYKFAGLERHFLDEAAKLEGKPRGFLFAVMARGVLVRQITNWIGDDGFMRKFSWRHIGLTPIGDALIANGKVTNKRFENGEYLVDMEVWLNNLRGNIPEVANATVSLLSKENPFQWK